jgi:hypothetical protein
MVRAGPARHCCCSCPRQTVAESGLLAGDGPSIGVCADCFSLGSGAGHCIRRGWGCSIGRRGRRRVSIRVCGRVCTGTVVQFPHCAMVCCQWHQCVRCSGRCWACHCCKRAMGHIDHFAPASGHGVCVCKGVVVPHSHIADFRCTDWQGGGVVPCSAEVSGCAGSVCTVGSFDT